MRLKFCGAAQNVTGSQHLIEVNGKKILLDCGLFQGGEKAEVRLKNESFLFNPKEIDYVLISHAHLDHIGRLPLLVKQGFCGKIFCTNVTKELSDAMLRDSAHIQQQDAEFVRKNLNKIIEPLYIEEDVANVMSLFKTHEYIQKFKLTDGVWCSFYDAGHVLGSAITVLDIREKEVEEAGKVIRLVYTGDLGRKYMPLLNDPYQVKEADILIIESTYASHVHDSIKTVREDLALIINNVIKRNGKIIVPGFSFERTQELVYVLHELYNENKIPKIPIFVDSPLSSKISRIFDKYRSYYDNETFRDFLDKKQSPFYFKEIKYIEKIEESKQLNSYSGSCIIISASGMCEAGRIKHHLKYHMVDPNNLILVIGFMAKGTRGRQIVEGAKNIRLFGEYYPLKAEVAVLNAFSAHADKLELLEYIRNINDLQTIFVVHGEQNECSILRDNIYNLLKFKGKVEAPGLGEENVIALEK